MRWECFGSSPVFVKAQCPDIPIEHIKLPLPDLEFSDSLSSLPLETALMENTASSKGSFIEVFTLETADFLISTNTLLFALLLMNSDIILTSANSGIIFKI